MPDLLLIQWALWTTGTALDRYEGWFRELTGLSPARVRSLNDELKAARYALEGSSHGAELKIGELVPPSKPRETGTAWDDLPKLEAENLADSRVAVIVDEEKLAVFPELIEASLVYVAPRRTQEEEKDFRLRFATSTEEAEALRDELRRVVREVRDKSRREGR